MLLVGLGQIVGSMQKAINNLKFIVENTIHGKLPMAEVPYIDMAYTLLFLPFSIYLTLVTPPTIQVVLFLAEADHRRVPYCLRPSLTT